MPISPAQALARARTGRRLSLFLVVYLVLTVLIGWRLVTVQVVSADEYRELAQRQTQREVALPPKRGKIYDRDGSPLAMSVPAAAVYANPRVLVEAGLDPTFVAAELAEVLDQPLEHMMGELTKDSGFVYLGRQLPRKVGEEVAALGLPGVGVLEEPERVYPSDSLAAQVVGYAGVDGEGLSGAEIAYDELLTGSPGLLRQETAPGGVEISSAPREVVQEEAGEDVVLTLDGRIQYTAERLLAAAVDDAGAVGGSAVVMEVDTGQILAMASAPGYDPDHIGDADIYHRRNRAVTDVFEPGSVAKAVTVAAALEEDEVSPDDEIDVPASIAFGSKTFTDSSAKPRRTLSVTDITAQSSNVGTILLADRLGDERLHEYLGRFGLGRSPGLGFPGESAGLLPAVDGWSQTSRPTMAIGQGVSGSLLQVAGIFETIASGGEWVAPQLARGTVGADGRLEPAGPPERRRAVSQETAAQLTQMLEAVVTDGTGAAAAVPGYGVAGKTGTAQKPSETRRGYEPGAYIAAFAGFAPVEDPQLIVAVMVDEPQGEHYGGQVAAPVFSELMEFALGHQRVAPSDPSARGQVDDEEADDGETGDGETGDGDAEDQGDEEAEDREAEAGQVEGRVQQG